MDKTGGSGCWLAVKTRFHRCYCRHQCMPLHCRTLAVHQRNQNASCIEKKLYKHHRLQYIHLLTPNVLHDAVSLSAISSISITAYMQAGTRKLDRSVPSRQELPQLLPQLHPCVPQQRAAARQPLLPCHCQARTWQPGLQWCCCVQPHRDQI